MRSMGAEGMGCATTDGGVGLMMMMLLLLLFGGKGRGKRNVHDPTEWNDYDEDEEDKEEVAPA